MDREYEIARYRPELKAQVAELQTHLWSPDVALNSAHFEWKYERNPYVAAPLVYLALCAGKVVGMRGFVGARWQVGRPAQDLRALTVGDLVIAPGHRDRGLFTRIMRTALNDLAERGYAYVISLSSSPVTRLGSLAMGWRSAGDLQTVRRRASLRIIRRRVSDYVGGLGLVRPAKQGNPFRFLDREAMKGEGRLGRHVSVERRPRPDGMAGVVRRAVGDGRIRHARDGEYLGWRFDSPLSQYRFLFWEGPELEGYLVLQCRSGRAAPRVNIVDWEATSPEAGTDLLEAALQSGRFEALSVWSGTLPEAVRSLLKSRGFERVRGAGGVTEDRPELLARPVRDDMLESEWIVGNQRLSELGNWDLRMIYSDSH